MYLIYCSFQIWGLILFSEKNYTTTQALNLASNIILYTFFFIFLSLFKLQNFNLKSCSKQNYQIDLLPLIVVPQLSNGWWHDYSTKTRPVGHANEQSIYCLMSINIPDHHFQLCHRWCSICTLCTAKHTSGQTPACFQWTADTLGGLKWIRKWWLSQISY